MELFKASEQHMPETMLQDLITLYTLHYDLTRAEAKKAIRRDALKAQ